MIDKLHRVVTLANGKKYFVLMQMEYQGDSFYLASGVMADGQDLKDDEFAYLQQRVINGREYIRVVKDPMTLAILLYRMDPEKYEEKKGTV